MSADFVFYAFAALTVLSGFFVVFSRNIVHAGFSLLFTLFGVAGLFAMLGADFLAVTQVMVYIGGILVLVLFTVMMTRVPRKDSPRRGITAFVLPGVFAAGILAMLYKAATGTQWASPETGEPLASTAGIGARFMTSYLFPFEYASLVLLAAMIGAAILIREAKKKDEPAADEGEEEVQS